MKITKYEHSAFVVESDGHRLGVDFGSFTSGDTLKTLRIVDALCVSHAHADHFSPAIIEALGGEVAAPRDVVAVLPPGRTAHVLQLGATTHLAGFAITPTIADHGPRLTRPVENYGLVIERGSRRIYYVGDAAVPSVPPLGPFDVVLVPIDGGGFVFDPPKAIDFVRTTGHRGTVVPVHDADPAEPDCVARFVSLAEGLCQAVVLGVGETLEVGS